MKNGPEGNTHPHITPALTERDGRTFLDPEVNRPLIEAQTAGKVKGTTDGGIEYVLSPAFLPDAPRWPNVDTHLWGMFPVLAIETGGYRDLEATDPFTGRHVTALGVIADGRSAYGALRLLIDVMEATSFLSEEERS